MRPKAGPSIARARELIGASYQWKSTGDEWYSVDGVSQALEVVDETVRRLERWSEIVLTELERDEGYDDWVADQRAELQQLLGDSCVAAESDPALDAGGVVTRRAGAARRSTGLDL